MHTRQRDAARGTREQRGYDAEWYRARNAAVAAEPWCHCPGCHVCTGTPCASSDLTGDHFIPRSKGGTWRDGIVVLCRRCNSSRGNRER